MDVLGDHQLRRPLVACGGRGFDDCRAMAVVRLLIDTGGRLAELTNLRWSEDPDEGDVDLDQRCIRVVGKGRRDRVVPVGVKTVKAIDRYVRARRSSRIRFRQTWPTTRHLDRQVPSQRAECPMQLRGARGPKNIALAALVGTALVTGFWRLGVGTWHTDEAVYAAAGRAYVQGDARMNWEHPMLAKYLFGVSQALFGNSAAGVRVAPALAGASVAGILFLFAKRVNGYWAGVGAAAAWVALPRAIRFAGHEFIPLKMERYALLDVIAAALGICALFAGWRWIEDRSWRSALWAGALVGLAAGAKLPGALFLPGILATAFAARRCRLVAGQALAATTAAILMWSLTYAPLGRDAPAAMRFMFEFQSEHAAQGHPTWLAGNAYDRTPWWGQLWMQWDGDGVFVNILFVAGCLAFAALGPPRAAAYLLLAVAMPFIVLSASSVALPHYRYLWLPPLTLLAALGWATLVRRHGKLRLLGVGCWTAVAVTGLFTLGKTLTTSHSDYAKLEEVLAAREVYPGSFFVDGHSAHLTLSFPASRFLTRDEFVGGAPADVVVVDAIMERRRADPAVPAEASGRGMESLQIDRLKVWLSV